MKRFMHRVQVSISLGNVHAICAVLVGAPQQVTIRIQARY